MRVRLGHVSNSSTSSFLVAFNDVDDFRCVSDRFGYDFFMNTLKASARKPPVGEEDIIDIVARCLGKWLVSYGMFHYRKIHNMHDYGGDRDVFLNVVSSLGGDGFDMSLERDIEAMVEAGVSEIEGEIDNLYEMKCRVSDVVSRYGTEAMMLAMQVVGSMLSRYGKFVLFDVRVDNELADEFVSNFMPNARMLNEGRYVIADAFSE